eukprot:Gb_34039 [translate_table: standard]
MAVSDNAKLYMCASKIEQYSVRAALRVSVNDSHQMPPWLAVITTPPVHHKKFLYPFMSLRLLWEDLKIKSHMIQFRGGGKVVRRVTFPPLEQQVPVYGITFMFQFSQKARGTSDRHHLKSGIPKGDDNFIPIIVVVVECGWNCTALKGRLYPFSPRTDNVHSDAMKNNKGTSHETNY